MFQDEGRALPRIVREQVALVVSGNQPLQLLPRGTSRNPRAHGNRQEISRKLALDYESAPVEPNVKALFRFADKLSRHPADVEKADVGELRKHGWNDDAILETTLVASLHACANRFSAGIGLVSDF